MAASLTASLLFSLLVSTFSVSPGQRIIRAEPGDNVILTCRAAENKDVRVVEWSRTDLGSDHYVLLYRFEVTKGQFDPDHQSPSFINRVDLLDVKNRDVSLVLKNVTTDDRGTYECRVVQRGNNRRKIQNTKPISIINLRVEPGNQEKQKEDGGNKDGLKEDGWIVIIVVLAVLLTLVLVVCFVLIHKMQRHSSLKPNPPPAPEAEPLQVKRGLYQSNHPYQP